MPKGPDPSINQAGNQGKKRILIVAPFVSMPWETGFNRFISLARGLAGRGHQVTLVTSRFSHYLKRKRRSVLIPNLDGYEVRFLDETGYRTNVSLQRAASHQFFLRNLDRFLSGLCPDYDLVYAALPMVKSAFLAGRWAALNKIDFVVDVQDLWPEAQAFALPGPTQVWQALLAPSARMADRCYAFADAVVGVSQTYLENAKKVVPAHVPVRAFYIGTAVDKFNAGSRGDGGCSDNGRRPLELVYIGSLGSSYDLATVFCAIDLLNKKSGMALRLTIFGDGPRENRLKVQARDLDIPVEFCGTVDHDTLARRLGSYDLAMNPYYKGSMQSLTNKFADYLAAGLPLINAANNDEVAALIRHNRMGYNYEPENTQELADILEHLAGQREKIGPMAENARDFALNYMDRNLILNQLFELVEGL